MLLLQAFEVEVEGGISDLVAIREELMIATRSGRIFRYSWEGQEIRDYSLDLRRIPFCVDQQVLKAVPVADRSVYVNKIAYSPLIGGYAIVLNDGRAALLVASTPSFDPNVSLLRPSLKLLCSGDPNYRLVWYSNGGNVSDHQMVPYSDHHSINRL